MYISYTHTYVHSTAFKHQRIFQTLETNTAVNKRKSSQCHYNIKSQMICKRTHEKFVQEIHNE